MATWLGNAFSLSMLPPVGASLACTPLTLAEAQLLSRGAESAVGHADTAELYAHLLERPVAVQRLTLRLAAGDVMVVGQYSGARLPEGARVLPEGAELRWWRVEVAAPAGEGLLSRGA